MDEINNQEPVSTPAANCPKAEVWLSLCAGQIGGPEAEGLLLHAAECTGCAHELGQASMILASDVTDEEEELLSRLPSSRVRWQKRVALEMRKAAQPPSTAARLQRRLFAWALVPASLAVLASAGVGLWVYRENHSVAHLLAVAYDERRLTALRLPGGKPADLWSPSRGSDNNEPIELAEARHQVESKLARNTADARMHQQLGEVDLVAMDPEAALTQLQIAALRQPKLPRIDFDLGAAYFEEAERGGPASDYGVAIEHFSAQLAAVKPPDPVALFDRALCWQRTEVPDLAKRDLTEALKWEKDLAWRQVIESQIEALPKDGNGGVSTPNPTSAVLRDQDYEVRLAELVEVEFDRGVRKDDAKVIQLTNLGRRHHDQWIADWSDASLRHDSSAADKLLSAAAQADGEGRSDEALPLARKAAALYHTEGNTAGRLRAQAEEIYALRRTGHPLACLEELGRIPAGSSLSRYPWLLAFLILERSSCLSQMGRFDEARVMSQQALDRATDAQLPRIAARARGYVAGFSTSQGLSEDAWRLNVLGLKETEPLESGTMRRYQFLSDLALDATLLDLPLTAASLAHESARMAADTGNLQVAAYAAELEGQDENEAGNRFGAGQAFARADAILARLPQGPATDVYRADWASDRAEMELGEGKSAEADATLQAVLPSVSRSGNFWIAFNYWTRRAKIESEAGNQAGALTSSVKAVECAESALKPMATPEERRAWEQRAEPAWISLIDSELRLHRMNDALDEWLWFRGAPEAVGISPGAVKTAASAFERWPQSAIAVFIRLPDRYQVFVRLPGETAVRSSTLTGDPATLDQMVREYIVLCADPHSAVGDIEMLGRQLYRSLLEPILPGAVEELRIDASSSLENLPFAALVEPGGKFFGEQTRVVNLAAWWGLRKENVSGGQTIIRRLFLVDVPTGSRNGPRIPAEYDEAQQVAVLFKESERRNGTQPDVGQVVREMSRATVIHFTGHALSDRGLIGLSLGVAADGEPVLLTASSLRGIRLRVGTLAFLAACSTFGELHATIEEPMALPSAFLRAGAGDVVGTQWAVDSDASRDVALEFYAEWLKGKSPAAALQSAQASLRLQRRFSHPYYWAAYSLLEV